MAARDSSSIDWRAAYLAGCAYTSVVFVFAFAVGTIRVMLVAPLVGALQAVIIEAPIVLAVSWRVSLWCARRFKVGRDARTRILMGAVAFALLTLLELGFSVFIFGESVSRYFAKFRSTPGAFGLVMQVCFATLPWIQSHSRFGTGLGAEKD